MHAAVREQEPGKCPICAMALVREEPEQSALRQLFTNPLHLAAMAVLMAILIGAAMLLH
jgi:hypothetical protein